MSVLLLFHISHNNSLVLIRLCSLIIVKQIILPAKEEIYVSLSLILLKDMNFLP